MACYRADPEGIVLIVRLTPRGGRDAINGIAALSDGREVAIARVRAAPERGAANAALAELVARTFGRPKTAVTLVGGATGRVKTLRIAGDPAALATVTEAWPRR